MDGGEPPAWAGRWDGRARFVVCELAFGDGSAFLGALAAWRRNPHRPSRLDWLAAVSASADPPAAVDPALEPRWPPVPSGRHRLAFDGGAVVLHLGFGDVGPWLRGTEATVDAFVLGEPPPDAPAARVAELRASWNRLAADDATVALPSRAAGLLQALADAGFTVDPAPARSARFVWHGTRDRPRTARTRAASRAPRRVAVVGAGLAGAATARSLVDEGIDVVLVEAQSGVAQGATGVAAGLFHAGVGDTEGAHARLARAASFAIAADVRAAIASGSVAGRLDGVLRVLETPAAHGGGEAPPSALEQRLDLVQARALAGVPVASGGRWMHLAGVVEPAGLVRAWLSAAAPRVQVVTGRRVGALVAVDGAWHVLDADGDAIATADAVVVAAGNAMPALLAPFGAGGWPLRCVRGQTSRAPAGFWSGAAPRLPLTGHGHAFVDATGALVFGATAVVVPSGGAGAVRVRPEDHAVNIQRLARLLGADTAVDPTALIGGAGIRLAAADRLPVIGAMPRHLDADGTLHAAPTRVDPPRHVPRVPGLFVCGAFGARGVLWSSLAGRMVAAAVTGAPMPVEADLVDAVDPARFASRAARRAAGRTSPRDG